MKRLNFLVMACFAGLSASALALPKFTYDYSDTRTLLTDDPIHFSYNSPSALWSGTLKTDAGDGDLYINAIEATALAGFDPSIGLSAPFYLDYFDPATGYGSYAFGTPISGGANWALQEIASFDNDWNSGTPAPGLYGFKLTFIGGADAGATNVLETFDLSLDVTDRLDVGLAASSTPIAAAGDVSQVSLALTNGMGRDLAITDAFVPTDGLQIDPLDPFSPSLDGTGAGDWKNRAVAAGASLTGAHSAWTANATSIDGTYTGGLGLRGGLHYGDVYVLYADPAPFVEVSRLQSVPEPASCLALALGAAALLRRRRR